MITHIVITGPVMKFEKGGPFVMGYNIDGNAVLVLQREILQGEGKELADILFADKQSYVDRSDYYIKIPASTFGF